jgi:hypothetical protein
MGPSLAISRQIGASARYHRAHMRSLLFLVIAIAACSGPSGGDPDAAVAADAADDGPPECTADCSCTDGATRPCGSDVGACSPGTETCVAGAWGSCTGANAPATEVCDGTLDDDCDGTVDNGCTTDPFVASNCGGVPWTQADALTRLGAATRAMLASATIQIRMRTCNGATCQPWSAGAPWQTRYLTYSGGVTTRYMNLQADTNLVVYAASGTAKMSVQHATFAAGGYTDAQGMVFDVPSMPLMYPVLRAYNVTPQNASDYRDLQMGVKNGVLELGARCARFTANELGASEPYTTEYAALYRW